MRLSISLHYLILYLSFGMLPASCQKDINKKGNTAVTGSVNNYYISSNGNDNNDGSNQHPWKSISRVKGLALHAGDSVLLRGGQIFTGSLVINYFTIGTTDKPVVISSYGGGMATISSAGETGLIINNCSYIKLQNIKLNGAGRKDGNTTDGAILSHCNNVFIDSLEISGYQKAGLRIRNCSDAIIQNVWAHDNGYAGIAVDGDTYSKTDCRNIEIKYCRTENNPGDPTNHTNHSGNGIIVSQCTQLKIAYCTATNNGWDMPRIGNGPVGIWAWEADSVTIEHCLSYQNKTSAGGEDGGGFDLDGGVTNSIIQYCLSYENHGSGIGLFEYNNASPWYNNTIRYNISVNDGLVSPAKAGIYIWNSSYQYKLQDCYIYNNTIFNDKNAAINYSVQSSNEGFVFYNNILTGNHKIISGDSITGKYLGNCWWSFSEGFNVNQFTEFITWATTKQQEILNAVIIGKNLNPAFSSLDNMTITDAKNFSSFQSAKTTNPVLLNGGIDLQQLFNITTGGKDFNGGTAPVKGIGASF